MTDAPLPSNDNYLSLLEVADRLRVPEGMNPRRSTDAARIKLWLARTAPRGDYDNDRVIIYFVRARGLGLIKIGRSTNLFERFEALSQGCPDELEILWAYWGPPTDEPALHCRFSRSRVRGEWFEPSDDLIRFIRKKPKHAARR